MSRGFAQRPDVDFADEASLGLGHDGFHGVSHILRAQGSRRVLEAAAGEFRGDAAGTDHTDADALITEIFRHAAGKTDDAPFRGAVDAAACESVLACKRA